MRRRAQVQHGSDYATDYFTDVVANRSYAFLANTTRDYPTKPWFMSVASITSTHPSPHWHTHTTPPLFYFYLYPTLAHVRARVRVCVSVCARACSMGSLHLTHVQLWVHHLCFTRPVALTAAAQRS